MTHVATTDDRTDATPRCEVAGAETLAEAIEAVDAGIVIWDSDMRLVACNRRFREFYSSVADLLTPGRGREEQIEALLGRSQISNAVGREAEWLAARRAARGDPGSQFEFQLRCGRWVRAYDQPMATGGTASFHIDVTADKERERDLAEREAQAASAWQTLSDAVEALGEGFAVYDADDRLVLCNASLRRMFPNFRHAFRPGRTYGEIIDDMLADGTFPDAVDREAEWKVARLAHRASLTEPFEYRTGEGRWIRAIDRRTLQGGTVSIRIDVTEARHRERDLAEKTRVLGATLDNMAQGIMVLGPDLRVQAINRRALELMAISAETARVGAHMADLIRQDAEGGEFGEGDTEELVNQQLAQLVAAQDQTVEHVHSNGTRVQIRRTVMPDGGWISTYTDITAQAEAEAELARLAEFSARNPNPVIEIDPAGTVTFVNRAARTQLEGIEAPGLTHPALAGVDEVVAPDRRGEGSGFTDEVTVGERTFQRRMVRGRDSDDLIVYFNDISELRRAERRIRESEDRHRQLLEQMPDAVLVHDGETVTYANPAAAAMFAAADTDALIGRRVLDLVPPDRHARVREHIAMMLEDGHSVGPKETRNLRLDGTEIQVQLAARPFVDNQGRTGIQLVSRDVTEQRRAEAEAKQLVEQLREAQKMEAIGTLAGGIAHDFNNLLGAIIGYADLASEDVVSGSQAAGNLDQIVSAGRRAQELVEQILTYSRREHGDKGPVRLDAVADEVLGLLRRTVPATIEIEPRIRVEDAIVEGKAGQIHQVLMNLCTNAVQAIGPNTGHITVELEPRRIDGHLDTSTGPLRQGDYYLFEVSDTGPGMDAKTAARMFEPFFTTKGVGEGTGMGLAVVHGIVGDHGGAIDVDSEPGQGTVMRVYLPRTPVSAPEARRPAVRSETTSGGGSILVIDDEPLMADMASEVLRRSGYQVECVHGGLEALAILRAQPAKFDLVITDQTMPNITGEALIREMRRLAPDMPVILSSGYGSALSERAARVIGADAFLCKPYAPRELSELVGRTLAPAAVDRTGTGDVEERS